MRHPKTSPEDFILMQALRDDGMEIPEIAVKFECSVALVYRNTSSKLEQSKRKAMTFTALKNQLRKEGVFDFDEEVDVYLGKDIAFTIKKTAT